MESLRAKIKRRLSFRDKNPNFDDHDEADEETTGYLQRQIDDAEKNGWEQGKPGSLLNRLIAHGNKKTEEQMKREATERGGTSSSSSSSR